MQVVSLQAAEAASRGQADRQRQLEDRAASMIREYRARYPDAVAFLQAECDMAARRGDFTQAIAFTREIDKVAKTSTLGPCSAPGCSPRSTGPTRWPAPMARPSNASAGDGSSTTASCSARSA